MKSFAQKLGIFLLILLGLDGLFPFKPQVVYSKVVETKKGEVLNAFLTPDDKWRLQSKLSELSPEIEKAIIAKEDKRFYYHFGVDPLALSRAFFKNLAKQKRTSGASTITMQTVRLLHPRPRTYFSKIIEILNAIQLEIHYSKKEILQMYLSLLPYGSNIEGIRAASLLYFQKLPDRLSLAEVATLCMVPNKPGSLRIGKNNGLVINYRDRLLDYLGRKSIFTKEEIAEAKAEGLRAYRHPMPKMVPHLALRTEPQQTVLTIDIKKQLQIEQILANYSKRIQPLGISNAMAILINNKTMEIEAYVGSQGFNDASAGQIDGIMAVRSPGSTLKPFLYGLAFDEGLVTPKSIVNDVPMQFMGFEPENFDQTYHGPVTVTYALANSLNIPAVALLDQISKDKLLTLLINADFNHIKKQKRELGLSMILGGCSTNMLELATAYACLANEGLYKTAKFTPRPSDDQKQLLSHEAVHWITEILKASPRPDIDTHFEYTYRAPEVAWKTGTSFAKKDAWCFGYNQYYTLGVWLGNFDNTGVPELSGATMATPLMLQIFNSIDDKGNRIHSSKNLQIKNRYVCSISGKIPQAFCRNQTLDQYIEGVSTTEVCSHMRQAKLTTKEHFEVCFSCANDQPITTQWVENPAPELLAFWKKTGRTGLQNVKHNPLCKRWQSSTGPKITFPIENGTYFFEPGTKMVFDAQIDSKASEVFWYLDDKFLQQNQAIVSPGRHRLSCTDELGRTTHVTFTVQ